MEEKVKKLSVRRLGNLRGTMIYNWLEGIIYRYIFRKPQPKKTYNQQTQIPAIKASICNGEQVAGFLDVNTKKFNEVMLIQSDKDLKQFKQTYQIEGEIKTIY